MTPLAFIKPAKAILTKIVGFIKDKIANKSSDSSILSKIPPMAIPIALIVFIGIVVTSNLDNISEKLGFDTKKTLSVKLNQEENNTNTAVAANRTTHEAVGLITETAKVKDIIIAELNEEVIKTIEETNKIEKERDKKIVKISTGTTTTGEQKRKQISETNIAAIWDSYCSFNQDSECSKQAA